MKRKQLFLDSIKKFHIDKNTLKQELKQVIVNECQTYGEAERYLSAMEKEMHWINDEWAILLISDLKKEFNNDKNNLPIQ